MKIIEKTILYYSHLKLFLQSIAKPYEETSFIRVVVIMFIIFNWRCIRKIDKISKDSEKGKKNISIINKKAGNNKTNRLRENKCKKKRHRNICTKNNIKADIINNQVIRKVIFDDMQNCKSQQKQDIKNEDVNLFLTNLELDKGIDFEIKTEPRSLKDGILVCPKNIENYSSYKFRCNKNTPPTDDFINKALFPRNSEKEDLIHSTFMEKRCKSAHDKKVCKPITDPSMDGFITKVLSTHKNEKQDFEVVPKSFTKEIDDSILEQNTKAVLPQKDKFQSNQNTELSKFIASQNTIDKNVKICKSNESFIDGFITKAPSLFSSISDKKIDVKIEKKIQPIKYHERLHNFLNKILKKSIPEIILKQEMEYSNMPYKQCLLEIAKTGKLKGAFFIPIMIITLLGKEKPYKEPKFYNRKKYLNNFLEYSKNDSEINKKLRQKYKSMIKKLETCEKITEHNVPNAHKTVLKQFEYDIDTFRKYFDLVKSSDNTKLLLQHCKICNEATLILLRASLLKELFKENIGIQKKYMELLKFTGSIINYRGKKFKNLFPKINSSKLEKEHNKKIKSRIKILKLIKKHTRL